MWQIPPKAPSVGWNGRRTHSHYLGFNPTFYAFDKELSDLSNNFNHSNVKGHLTEPSDVKISSLLVPYFLRLQVSTLNYYPNTTPIYKEFSPLVRHN